MKTRIVVCLFLAGACFAASNSDRWTVREEETIQKTLTLSGPPMRLLIDNVDGYVHVSGTNGSEVQVTAHKTIRADADSDLQQAKNEVKLTIEEKPGTVSVYYDAPWRCNNCCNEGCRGEHRRFYNVTYDIDVQVPRAARVVISTVNHGDVRVEGTAGDFDVSNVNGGIAMTSVSGSGECIPSMGRFASSSREIRRGRAALKASMDNWTSPFSRDYRRTCSSRLSTGRSIAISMWRREPRLSRPSRKTGDMCIAAIGCRAGAPGRAARS